MSDVQGAAPSAKPRKPGEGAGDVVEGGRPPRRHLPRGLVVGLQAACAAVALVWVVMEVVVDDGGTLSTPAPTVAPTIEEDVPAVMEDPFPDLLDCRGPDQYLSVCADHMTYAVPLNAGEEPHLDTGWFRGLNSLTVGRDHFTLHVRDSGWARFGSGYISKSTFGPQGAEALFYWTGFPEGDWAGLCPSLGDLSPGSARVDVAAAVSTAAGTDVIAGPSTVTVGGRTAQHMVLTVGKNFGCQPGYFYSWRYVAGGPFWPDTVVGDTIRVWIVDGDGSRLLFFAGITHVGTSPELDQEIQQIVESISFE